MPNRPAPSARLRALSPTDTNVYFESRAIAGPLIKYHEATRRCSLWYMTQATFGPIFVAFVTSVPAVAAEGRREWIHGLEFAGTMKSYGYSFLTWDTGSGAKVDVGWCEYYCYGEYDS